MAEAIVKVLAIRDMKASYPEFGEYVSPFNSTITTGHRESLLLSVSQAAKMLGVSDSTFLIAIDAEREKAIRFGKRIQFLRSP